MSIPFNSGNSGLIQRIERKIYGQDAVGRISGNSTLLAQWTADLNIALDKAYALIFQTDGRWQFDDANHTGNPTVTTDITDGQRSYQFVQDSAGNYLLDILRVYIKVNGIFQEIYPVDEMSEPSFYDGLNAEGAPQRYGKKGSTIYLDPIPSATVTGGMKVECSREGSYFTVADTTKRAGFAGIVHDYLVAEVCYQYALSNDMKKVVAYERDLKKQEGAVKTEYGRRMKDERPVIRNRAINPI